VSAKIPAEAIEGLMKKAFIEETISPELFWDALLNASLTVPLAKNIDSSDPTAQIPMLLGQHPDGDDVVWLFTSPTALKNYTEQDLPSVDVESQSIFSKVQTLEHEVLLIGPQNLTLSLHPDLIDALAEGRVPDFQFSGVEQKEGQEGELRLQVTAPTEKTAELEKRFTVLFQTMPDILEAAFVQVSDRLGSRLLLGITMAQESRDALRSAAERVASSAEGALHKGKSMDITLINGSLKEAFEKWGKFFYKKQE
jgi:hypothetical protein